MIYELQICTTESTKSTSIHLQIPAHATFADLHETIHSMLSMKQNSNYFFIADRSNGYEIDQMMILPEKRVEYFSEEVTYFDDATEKLFDWVMIANDQVTYVNKEENESEISVKLIQRIAAMDNDYPRCIKIEEMDLYLDKYTGEDDAMMNINQALQGKQYQFRQEKFVHNNWPELLLKAKQFQQLKPWKYFKEEPFIFAIYDKKTEKYYFCSVMGSAEETFGLAVYEGIEGHSVLVAMMTGEMNDFDLFQRTRGVTLIFEDRNELSKDEYEFIKTYGVSFRGKKAWPIFLSYQPGHALWRMERQEDVQLMIVAIEHVMAVYEKVSLNYHLPNFYNDKVLVRQINENETVDDIIYEVEELIFSNYDAGLHISEIELKRLTKFNKKFGETLEFTVTYINFPIQLNSGERPIYPIISLGFLYEEEQIIYYDMHRGPLDESYVQHQFMNVLLEIKCIPGSILTDDRTYFMLVPLLHELRFDEMNIDVRGLYSLPAIDEIKEGLEQIGEEMEEE